MNERKYNTDRDVLLKKGKEIMSSTDESRYLFKVFAVNMVVAGDAASRIAELAGVSTMTVSTWVKTADEQGFEALRPQPRSGRPTKLTESQLKEIDELLQTDPKDSGYKVWDGPTLSAHIKATYDIEIGVRQCQRLFHALGYSRIRPQQYPSKGYEDTEERKEFKKKDLK